MTTTALTDPLSVFRSQHTASAAGPDDFLALPPQLRMMIRSDGSTTANLEAWHGEPIATELVSGTDVELGEDVAGWLDADPGSAAHHRRVRLIGRRSARWFADAESVLLPDRIPPVLAARVGEPGFSLGAAIVAAGLETRRELLWFDREVAGAARRTYRIVMAGRPVALVVEALRIDA